MKTASQLFRRLALLLGMTTFLFNAWAQNQATLTPIGKWPDYPLPLAYTYQNGPVGVAGSYAYLAGYGLPLPEWSPTEPPKSSTLQLVTLDVSKPSQPRYLSHVDTLTDVGVWDDWYGAHIQVCGTYAYVALGGVQLSGPSMLAVFSLSEPALPRLVGTLALSGCARGIDVVGDRAYVIVAEGGPRGRLLVVDVSDPAHPTLETSASFETYPFCFSVAGGFAYVGGLQPGVRYGRVEIIDISNPGQALVVGGFDLTESSGGVTAIAAEGSLLHCCSRFQSNYDVFDRTDPLNPFPIGRWELKLDGPATSIRVIGSTVILAGHLFGTGSPSQSFSMCILDVVDPQNPQLRGQVHKVDGDLAGLDVSNPLAYLRDGGELRVLDIQDPAAPVQIGQIDTGFGAPLISVEGDLACLLDGPRLRVLNVSNPRAPALVGVKDLVFVDPYPNSQELKVVAQRGFLIAENSLRIIDLRNPSQPVEAGRLDDQGFRGLDVAGDRAYVTVRGENDTGWLKVIDVSNAQTPVELGSLYFPDDSPYKVEVVGDHAYVRLYDTHLAIIDVRNPSSMVRVADYHPNGSFDEIQVVGSYAYMLVRSDSEKSLHIVDLADPAHPARVGRYLYDPGTVWRFGPLHVSGRHAFINYVSWTNTDDLRMEVVDILDPTRPVKAGEYDPEGSISGLAMVGNTLYTTSDAGLTVLDFFAPNTSPRLRLNLPVLASGVAVLTWEGGPNITLQKTTSLTNPNWQDVPGTTGQSLAILPQTDAAFFRLTMP